MWLDRLRKRPRAARQQVAFLGAAGITAVVALVWMVSVSVRLGNISESEVAETSDTPGAFSQFFSGLEEQTAAVLDSFTDTDAASTTQTTSTTTVDAALATTTAEEPFRWLDEAAAVRERPPARPVLIEVTSSSTSSTTQ